MPPRRLDRRRKAAVYVTNRESAVRTMMRDTAANPLYPLNVETKWVPAASSVPPWSSCAESPKQTRLSAREHSPPSSPVYSPPVLRSSHGVAPERLANSNDVPENDGGPPDNSTEVSGISSIRRRLFEAIPQHSETKPRWKSANDIAEQPQSVRRRRHVVARDRRLKRFIRSTAEIIVGAAAAGDVAGLKEWMTVDDSYCNCEASLPHHNSPTSPLIEASKNGHLECCRLLMLRGARLDDLTRAAPGWSALMEAAVADHVDVVNALCGFGADPLVESKGTGSTALSLASMHGHAAAVAGLLALGGLLPRAVAQAASGLAEVASALDELEPKRKIMAEKDRYLWVLGKECERMKNASKRSKRAFERRASNKESRLQSAKLAQAGFVWLNTGDVRLRRDFFAWRAQTAATIAEHARLRDVEARKRYNHSHADQELALVAAAAARQDLDEIVEQVQRLAVTAMQRLELAQSRANLVGSMFAHTDIDGLTPVCHAAISRDVPTIRVMATCGAGTPGNHNLRRALATARARKSFAAYRCLTTAQQDARRPDTQQRPFDLSVLLHLRDETYELSIEADAAQPLDANSNESNLVEELTQSSSAASQHQRDSGSWWARWVGSCANCYQVVKRCDTATQALQLVSNAANAAAGAWQSGPEQRGRVAALRQQSRRLHRELIMRLMAEERAAARPAAADWPASRQWNCTGDQTSAPSEVRDADATRHAE